MLEAKFLMIYLAITPLGLANALSAATPNDAVWCGRDAISEVEYATTKRKNLSRFAYTFHGEGAAQTIRSAIDTVVEHHPGQSIWIEASLTE